jgi:hypothetical protein
VPQKIKFEKQYKPIKFGDGPDPESVEGHRNRMIEAAETRRYNRRMKELLPNEDFRPLLWSSAHHSPLLFDTTNSRYTKAS